MKDMDRRLGLRGRDEKSELFYCLYSISKYNEVRGAKASCLPKLLEMALTLWVPCRLDKYHSARLSEGSMLER